MSKTGWIAHGTKRKQIDTNWVTVCGLFAIQKSRILPSVWWTN